VFSWIASEDVPIRAGLGAVKFQRAFANGHDQAYKEPMKAIGLFLLALSVAGCSSPNPHRYALDPRAALVGPAYLDYMAEFPRDRDTECFYPSFTSRSVETAAHPTTAFADAGVPPAVAALLIDIPQPNPNVDGCAGTGYPKLERTGIRLFTAAAK
jgi:hypothetical protein